MAKNNMELVCSIGELTSLFEKKTNIPGFLQEVVQLVAEHMSTDACSVFLRDVETEDLILSATTGLSHKAVGKVKLFPGEGITGQALKLMIPINDPNGPLNPHFRFVPGIMEEKYTATLAVPIVHGLNRIGVILLQHSQIGYFDDKDVRALKTIASQLATLLENAKLLMELHKNKKSKAAVFDFPRPYSFICSAETKGVSLGKAVILCGGKPEEESKEDLLYGHTLEDFERALYQTEHQLEELQLELEKQLSDIGSLIFGSHLLMLKDDSFSGSMKKLIRQGCTPVSAIKRVVGEYTKLFSENPNLSVQEKVQDLKDLEHRLTGNLSLNENPVADYTDQIIVAEDILPSELAKLAAQHAEGFLIYGSGATTHLSILARSFEVPLAYTKDQAFFSIQEGEGIVIDGYQNAVVLGALPESIQKYMDIRSSLSKKKHKLTRTSNKSVTKDGKEIILQANINLLSDLPLAKCFKAQGIGLYRSEFPFIIRNTFPTEEEQYKVYSRITAAMKKKDIVFRTLDIGGDKMIAQGIQNQEANPSLGLRAIRFSLKNKDIFKEQLRAMLRAGADTNIKILFPLISFVDEFLEAKDICKSCIEELESLNIPHNSKPEYGVMIEIPSAVIQAESLAREADFLSIGTNDLVQYLLGVDRSNQLVSDLYNPLHPAVLNSLYLIKKAAAKHGKPLSICGEAAADKTMLLFLLGIGIKIISVDPRLIPKVHKEIEAIDSEYAAIISKKLLKLSSYGEIKEFISEHGI